jgi:TDG/mug DNA glycosylase family protein
MKSTGFDPVAHADARVLVLGTLPGKISLQRREYYAHRGNAFWRIMGELAGASGDLVYEDRVSRLKEKGIALWDVLASGYRSGSRDAAIQLSTAEPNDFGTFLSAHKDIRLICFNGKRAEKIYDRKVPRTVPAIRREVLPSTSSAYPMKFDQKLSRWRNALRQAGCNC